MLATRWKTEYSVMKHRFFNQIFFGHLLISLLLLISIAVYTLRYLHNEQFTYLINKTNLLWNHLSSSLIDITDTLNNPQLNDQIRTLSHFLNASIYIYDNQDRIIVRYQKGYFDDTEYEQSPLEDKIRLELKTVAAPREGKHFNLKDLFISSYPILFNSQINGYFVVIQDMDVVLKSWNKFVGNLLLLILVVFTLTLIIFIIYTRKLIVPIKHLTRAASLINLNNLDIPIIVPEENEIGELAKQFRQMSINLKMSFEKINSQKETLMTIMNAMNQSIWIVDENATIKMANQNFEKLVGRVEYEGKPLFELLRNHDIIKIYHDVVESKQNITREIELFGCIYLCTASFLLINENVIISLIDITDIKSVERFKKDLVSNVSHELKTPLTAIKGFVETLSEDANEEQKKYLEIVSINTERLIAIVNDLLVLSKLEQSFSIIKHEIDIKSFIDKINVLFVDALKKQNMTLQYIVSENMPAFYADEFMLEQAFINLIDNAIKYAASSEITVSVEHINASFIIKVSDKGIGISQKDLKRIFERFYVVDRSRSKRMGGTGLGLAIVKHVVQLHQGEISVESEEGKGSVFKIVLPE